MLVALRTNFAIAALTIIRLTGLFQTLYIEFYVYWTVHHLDS